MLDELAAEVGFSGVAQAGRAGEVELGAYGYADRAHAIPNRLDTRFGIASGTKGLTALTVLSLVEDGVLALATPARSLLGDDLPLVDDRVTVEHLLAHRSGMGDYLDEEVESDFTKYLMPVPVHELATTEDYLAVLDGHPQKFPPGERVSYCNSGYVVLALLAERASGVPFPDLVQARVCEPAGMRATEFLRSDELPGDAAIGYLGDGPRTNVLHLPVRGSGDGGVYTTIADVERLWHALFAGAIVPLDRVAQAVESGLGLPRDGESVFLQGGDAGVAFHSVHDPRTGRTQTVISNVTLGAGALVRALAR
jgi:CubicO group peptidase (beta-lactamase class C family)